LGAKRRSIQHQKYRVVGLATAAFLKPGMLTNRAANLKVGSEIFAN
jgi:hypothetical protein